jgi:2-polyprenyl-3-methyl-5-hydroxy-6-metoxy-1,4-benzoquinol methylase
MPNETYYTHLRTDVLALVPDQAKTVLSVGCGEGLTEAELVKRGVRVVGIEIDPSSAAEAEANGLEMLEGDATELSRSLSEREFDCLLYADVLEHIADPVELMKLHVSSLRPGGCAIVSVPNFRHFYVFQELFLRGHIRYQEAGVLDRTHVRITTRKLIQEWFGDVGLRSDVVRYQIWRKRERLMSGLSLGLLREFFAAQIVLRGVKPA